MAHDESNYFTYRTQHGPMTIRASKHGICEIALSNVRLEGANRASEITNSAATQIQEYLAGKRTSFDLPLDMRGSAFQKAVWTIVCDIPYGETRSAADIADALGKPGAHRSVGTAIRRNPLPLLVPTHRVVLPGMKGDNAKVFSALRALEASRR